MPHTPGRFCTWTDAADSVPSDHTRFETTKSELPAKPTAFHTSPALAPTAAGPSLVVVGAKSRSSSPEPPPAGEQTSPLPTKPGLHVQLNVPGAFWHAAFGSQPPLPVAHSSMSVQTTPEPV